MQIKPVSWTLTATNVKSKVTHFSQHPKPLMLIWFDEEVKQCIHLYMTRFRQAYTAVTDQIRFSRGNLSNKTLNNMSVSPNIGLLNLASTACLLSFTLLFFPPVLKSVFHWFKHFQILWIRKVYVCVIAARHLLHCCILFQIKLWAQSSNALIVLYFQSCSVTASFGISLSYMPLKIKGYALKFRQTGPCLLFCFFASA